MTNTVVDAVAALHVTEYWVVEVDRHDGTCCTFGPFTADAAWARLEHRTAHTRFAARCWEAMSTKDGGEGIIRVIDRPPSRRNEDGFIRWWCRRSGRQISVRGVDRGYVCRN
jgi:hypothetical protein